MISSNRKLLRPRWFDHVVHNKRTGSRISYRPNSSFEDPVKLENPGRIPVRSMQMDGVGTCELTVSLLYAPSTS